MASTQAKPKTGFAWSRSFHAFAFKGKPLRGVHPTLTSVFYPDYSFAKATLGPTSSTPDSATQPTRITKYAAGKRAGTCVDLELKRVIALLVKYDMPFAAAVNHAQQVKYADQVCGRMSARDRQLFKKKLSSATTKLLQTMHKLQLTPMGSQIVVGCTSLRIATALDVLCKDDRGRHVVIQIKTGYASYYFRHTPTPLRHIAPPRTDCVANQHQLQLLLELELYRRSHPQHATSAYGLLMRVDALGVDVVPIQKWTVKCASTVFSALQASAAVRSSKH